VAGVRRIGCLLARAPLAPPAQRALLDVALSHSPRVEEAGPGLVYLDLTGLRGLFGEEPAIGEALHRRAAERGLAVSVGIGGSRASAGLAARLADPGRPADPARLAGPVGLDRPVMVVPPGEDETALAPAPLSVLPCGPEMLALLRRWGLRTLGEVAALPAAALHERLGADGPRLRELARGIDRRPLDPWAPERVLEESMDLDWDIAELPALAEVVSRLIERIAVRLAREDWDADRLEWELRLSDQSVHDDALHPAVPGREPVALTVLIMGALAASPPPAAVRGVTLRAHPTRVPPAQSSLGDPMRPGARALAQAVSRLAALVGTDQVGVPRLVDTHRPDAVSMRAVEESRRPDGSPGPEASARLALRRLRPPTPATVRLAGGRPAHVVAGKLAGDVVRSAGPWRTAGDWWRESRWGSDEWDAELADGTLCRLAHDGTSWALEGIYD
jgi:protein ImuB